MKQRGTLQMDMLNIIGLRVTAILGLSTDKRVKKYIEPVYILFSDGKTYIELEEQDYYSYHDCATNARHLHVWVDENMWSSIFRDHDKYPIANTDL